MKKKYLDFMPKDDARRPGWCNNAYQKADTVCPQLGMIPAEITEFKDALQYCTDTYNNVGVKKTDLAEAVKAKDLLDENQIRIIRRFIGKMKRSANYNAALGAQLGIVGTAVAIDMTELKPLLKLKTTAGMVLISFVKQHMPGISIYSRQRDTQTWQKIAQVSHSPFLDTRNLTEAGKPEAREYMALFHDGNTEVGQESDVASILTGTQASNV
jgi:hypothetical protein